MGAGIAAAAALRPRPAVTVVLTDGYTPWPERAPKGIRVVVGPARRRRAGRAAVGPRRPGRAGLSVGCLSAGGDL